MAQLRAVRKRGHHPGRQRSVPGELGRVPQPGGAAADSLPRHLPLANRRGFGRGAAGGPGVRSRSRHGCGAEDSARLPGGGRPGFERPFVGRRSEVAIVHDRGGGRGRGGVYKDNSPDPQSVARDLNDLVTTPELGVSVFKAPSVLPYVSVAGDGARMLVQLVNYATEGAK